MPLPEMRSANSALPKPKLLDQVRETIRRKHYSLRTESTYIDWIKRYIFFHQKRHPKDMGSAEIEQFLNHLAVEKRVAASTQNQALSAIVITPFDPADGTGSLRSFRALPDSGASS